MNRKEYLEYLETQTTKILREIETNLINIYRVSIQLHTTVKRPIPYLKELYDIVHPWSVYLKTLSQTASTSKGSKASQVATGKNSIEKLNNTEKDTLEEISNLLQDTTEKLSLHNNLSPFDEQKPEPSENLEIMQENMLQGTSLYEASPTTLWKDLIKKYSEETETIQED